MIARVVALAVLLVASAYVAFGLELARGTAARPGPGFFPLAVGLFAVGVAVVFVVLVFKGATSSVALQGARPGGGARAAATMAALLGFCFLLPWVGYPVSAFLFVVALLRCLGAGWGTTVATALLGAAGSHYVFATLLGVPLPGGMWTG